ncbi:hypothetical protein Mycsm_01263 [Mycobacterium sp. JS623]|nr:hypothetical protein Mycsm_01263 [Mycobacterium sp. JS623]
MIAARTATGTATTATRPATGSPCQYSIGFWTGFRPGGRPSLAQALRAAFDTGRGDVAGPGAAGGEDDCAVRGTVAVGPAGLERAVSDETALVACTGLPLVVFRTGDLATGVRGDRDGVAGGFWVCGRRASGFAADVIGGRPTTATTSSRRYAYRSAASANRRKTSMPSSSSNKASMTPICPSRSSPAAITFAQPPSLNAKVVVATARRGGGFALERDGVFVAALWRGGAFFANGCDAASWSPLTSTKTAAGIASTTRKPRTTSVTISALLIFAAKSRLIRSW